MQLIWNTGLHEDIFYHFENKDTILQIEVVSIMW